MIELGDILVERFSQTVVEEFNELWKLSLTVKSTEETSKAVEEQLVHRKKFSLAHQTRKSLLSYLRVDSRKSFQDIFDHMVFTLIFIIQVITLADNLGDRC